MNKFDLNFFNSYIPEWHELINVVHIHPIVIFKKLFLIIGLFVIIPSVIFYNSITIQDLVPFYYFEIYLFLVYIKVIYEVFNWYNDVWLITSSWVVSLTRALFKTNSDTLSYENIEWIWVEMNSVFDKILWKWDLVIHKIWNDTFVLKDAIMPYKAVDIIEWLWDSNKDSDITEERFNMILKSLNWVVWKYEDERDFMVDKEEEKKKYIENTEKTEWTIDLR